MDAIKVFILTGSDSDLPRMSQSKEMLDDLGIQSEIAVASAHRNPERVTSLLAEAEAAGAEIIIAGAGMSAALPGVVASQTDLPVIGVPLDSGMPGGLDALFSMVQMPTGIPVATVAVNGAKNAAVLAARILSLNDPVIRDTLKDYRRKLAEGGSK